MENIRDWCISRQIWWGHRIPVYYCDCGHIWASPDAPDTCPKCGMGKDHIKQDEDVLDTWFSSWLWPFSTLGWPEKTEDLARYYPTNDLCTAPDIIFFWVARMIMAGCKFMGDVPFRNVVLHGVVRDDQGRKMSKSLGNSLDPLKIIDEYSADSLRFSLMQTTSPGVDVYISMNKFEIGRNFGTKIWNVSRFIEMYSDKILGEGIKIGSEKLVIDPALLTDDDRHILAKGDAMINVVTSWLEKYRFQDAALAIYDFVWSDFCDWYVESSKSALNSDNEALRKQKLAILFDILGKSLRVLHPFMPFLTEELWHQMGYCRDGESIMRAPWPATLSESDKEAWGINDSVVAYVEAKHELITAGRALRTQYNIAPSKQLHYVVKAASQEALESLNRDKASIAGFLRAEPLEIGIDISVDGMPGTTIALGAVHLPLAGLIDVKAELEKIAAEVAKNKKFLLGIDAKLSNEGFVSRAPAAVVDQQRQKKAELEAEIARLEALAATFAAV